MYADFFPLVIATSLIYASYILRLKKLVVFFPYASVGFPEEGYISQYRGEKAVKILVF